MKVFGADVKQYRLRELRGRIGVAPQRAALFRGTIRENLQWGKPGATDEEITRALTVAQAADFVFASPEGLDTPHRAGRAQPFRRAAAAAHHRPRAGGRAGHFDFGR